MKSAVEPAVSATPKLKAIMPAYHPLRVIEKGKTSVNQPIVARIDQEDAQLRYTDWYGNYE